MNVSFFTTCTVLTTGCLLYQENPGINLVINGFYSDSINCYQVVNGAITSINSCTGYTWQTSFSQYGWNTSEIVCGLQGSFIDKFYTYSNVLSGADQIWGDSGLTTTFPVYINSIGTYTPNLWWPVYISPTSILAIQIDGDGLISDIVTCVPTTSGNISIQTTGYKINAVYFSVGGVTFNSYPITSTDGLIETTYYVPSVDASNILIRLSIGTLPSGAEEEIETTNILIPSQGYNNTDTRTTNSVFNFNVNLSSGPDVIINVT